MSDNAKTILVVAAHPDDEVLGCGATIARRVREGATAHVLFVTGGVAGRYADPSAESGAIRAAQEAVRADAKTAAGILGFASCRFLDFPDNRLDTAARQDIAHAIDGVIEEARPDTLFTHHPGDYNWDHGIVFDAVMMAARVNPGEHAPARLYTFEVPSSTERAAPDPHRAFAPNVYVDVAATFGAKLAAMDAYRTERRDAPHPRSAGGLDALARKRGFEAGLKYAEAFCLVREIKR
ncbi:PIG-L family deacetylase [bacterium]|nr:PIG-L family deacetylase [bacterium]